MTGVERDEIAALDGEAFRLARGQERLRLVVGEALERLVRKRHHRKEGFRNLRAYSAERCGKSATWAAESRTLAKRLRKRLLIREALRLGKIGWSMAVVLARHATDEDEAELVELGRSRTVQVVKELLKERGGEPEPVAEERWATLSLTLTREDALLLEATRLLVQHLDGAESKDGFLEALLAEGQTSMIARGPAGVDVLGEDLFARYQGWLAQRALHDIRRAMAEERAEPAVVAQASPRRPRRRAPPARRTSRSSTGGSASGAGSSQLGYEATRLIARIADPDTEAAWVERGGKRTFKHFREEVQAMELVGRIAGDARGLLPPSEEEMAELQAFERDVITGAFIRRVLGLPPAPVAPVPAGATASASAADPAVQIGAHSGVPAELLDGGSASGEHGRAAGPPAVQIGAHAQLAQGLAEGEPCRGEAALDASAPDQGAPPAGPGGADRDGAGAAARLGRVAVRYAIREELLVQWRALERAWEQCGAPGTYVGWLCLSFWSEWVRDTGRPMKWGDVYARDLYRCTSPICFGKDPTPHHLLFRSKGGTDELENLAGLCPWCHLEGVHGIGSIEVLPPASKLTWRFGREPWLEVVGRQSRRL